MGLPETVITERPVRIAYPNWLAAARRVLWSPYGVTFAVVVLLGLLAPVLTPYNPVAANPGDALASPSLKHPFGTDSFGFDVLCRVLYSTRTDLWIAFAGVTGGVLAGVVLGSLAAYVGRFWDTSLMRTVEIALAFPQLLFAMIVFAAAGNSPFTLVVILWLLNGVFYIRYTRSLALPLRDIEFVLAARVTGLNSWRVVTRHIVPTTLGPVFGQFAISVAYSIQLIAGLSFIGLGVQQPTPEWGSMIQIGAEYMAQGKWWPSVFPGLAIVVTTWALMGIARRLRTEVSGL